MHLFDFRAVAGVDGGQSCGGARADKTVGDSRGDLRVAGERGDGGGDVSEIDEVEVKRWRS